MMKKLIITLLLTICGSSLFAQKTLWTTGNARTLAKGQQEFGIIQPFQIGITDKLEASFSPLAGLSLVPNVSFKYRYNQGPWLFASQHTYMMPSMLMHSIQDHLLDFMMPELIFPTTLRIPYIFTFRNQVMVTRRTGEEMLVTGKLGVEFSLKTKGDVVPELTYPPSFVQYTRQLYLHTTTFHNKVVWYGGVRVDGNIYKNYNYMAEVDFVSSGFDVAHWAVEQKSFFIFNKSPKFAALIGYKMSYGTYPDFSTVPSTSTGKFYIFPMADLIWKLNIKREPAKDLFRVK